MDGTSFDRLSVAVHRLRDATTRRQALRTFAAGGVAGLLAGLGPGRTSAACTDRKKRCDRNGECCNSSGETVICDQLPSSCDRKGDRCCGFTGASCSSKCDCCSGFKCSSNGRCKVDSGGGQVCGNSACQDGWSCCRFNGTAACYDPDYLRCCSGGICPKGWDCCGTSQCCTTGWKCCGGGRCCPDGWECGDIACTFDSSSDRSAASEDTIPFADAVPADEAEWIKNGWLKPTRKRARK